MSVTSFATSGTLQILTSPDLNVDIAGWASAGSSTTILPTPNGVKIITLTGMADYIRWNVSAISGSATFSVVVYTFDA